jgi:hypothetical protein
MDDNWYALQQHMHDRITEARAAARARSLVAALPRPTAAGTRSASA